MNERDEMIDAMEHWAGELQELAALCEKIANDGCDRRVAVAALGTLRVKLSKAPNTLPEHHRTYARAMMHSIDTKIRKLTSKADIIPFNRKEK